MEFVVEDVGRRVRTVWATRTKEVHQSNIENNQEENDKYYKEEESNTLEDSVGTAGKVGNPGWKEGGEREKERERENCHITMLTSDTCGCMHFMCVVCVCTLWLIYMYHIITSHTDNTISCILLPSFSLISQLLSSRYANRGMFVITRSQKCTQCSRYKMTV